MHLSYSVTLGPVTSMPSECPLPGAALGNTFGLVGPIDNAVCFSPPLPPLRQFSGFEKLVFSLLLSTWYRCFPFTDLPTGPLDLMDDYFNDGSSDRLVQQSLSSSS